MTPPKASRPTSDDCDDAEPTANPSGTEVADDGVDQDCSGTDTITCIVDADQDGFGTALGTTTLAADGSCDTAQNESATSDDCDDDPLACGAGCFPGNPAADVCDGADQDCDSLVDEDPDLTWYHDADGDGFTNSADTQVTCTDPDGAGTEWVAGPTTDDCNDADAGIFPGASETPDDGIDQDCNGSDTITCIVDADQDGFGTVLGTTTPADDGSCDTAQGESTTSDDCDDAEPTANPSGTEVPDDGIDQDCSGTDTITCIVDADQDGFGTALGTTTLAADGSCDTAQNESTTSDDCDDDPLACGAGCFPGNPALDVCDGLDQDCDSLVDEDPDLTWYHDADGDGFTNGADTQQACTDPDGAGTEWVASPTTDDCNDADAAIFPGATETPDDGIDQDCSGTDTITCIVDADQDGFGTSLGTTTLAADGSCDTAQGESTTSDDCDDAEPTANPSGTEVPDDGVDQDCSGTDTITCIVDADQDGFGTALGTTTLAGDGSCDTVQGESTTSDDCDDDPLSCGAGCFPGNLAEDVCDGADQDCDSLVDEDPDLTWYHDADGDGFTNSADTQVTCTDPDGAGTEWVSSPTTDDCNDADAGIFPGATETPDDGTDQDCSGSDTITCIVDADQDGFGTALGTTTPAEDGSCDTAQGESTTSDDCDDAEPTANPSGTEVPDDGIDQDCSGTDTITCIVDADQDGFGTALGTTTLAADGSCDTAQNESTTSDDCDDDPLACGAGCFPGNPAADVCDGLDQDCDSLVDDDPDLTWYHDADGDGFTNGADTQQACTDPDGAGTEWVASPTTDDCNDADAGIFPGASETPDDGIDQDCSGTDTITCIVDADQDGFGTALGSTTLAADGSCDTAQGESTTSDDCDDAEPTANPSGTEVADDGVDQDCSGTDTITCIVDADQDGFGTALGTTTLAADGSCDTAQNESATSDDCDDDPLACGAGCFPGNPAADVCDGADQDCDSLVDEDPDLTWYHDADGDGFTNSADTQVTCTDPDGAGTEWVAGPTTDDCNDADAGIFPGASETPDDGIDQDCNGSDTITCIVDADQDGFGTVLGTTTPADDGSCDTAQGESTTSDDCDDAEPTANPSGTEVPDDGIDQDCSGTDTITCIVDADQDGFGTALGTTTLAADGSCDTAQNESTTSDDCDDDPLACGAGCFPGNPALDVCDGLDQDCDSLVDEDPDLTWYHDADGDGFTNGADTQQACTDPDGAGTEWVASPTTDDCNDADAAIFPGATETPDDGIDQDCSGTDTITCIVDADQDGFGTSLGTTTLAADGSCDTAQGESTTSDDCDDAEPTANPSGTEVPDDGVDQDCSGTDTITCIVDADQDGFGTALGTTTLAGDGSCDTVQGESTTSDDCDDDPLSCGAGCFPGNLAEDVCDGADQDCDSLVDEDPDLTWYHDADGDGFTNSADTQVTCTDPDGAGTEWVSSPTTDDCNDADAGIFPGATETPDDGTDQDCSGSDTITCIVDADQDGFGTALGTTTPAEDGSCDTAQGESTTSDDCDDAEPTANPSGTEVPDDGIDQDCSGTDTITCIVDADQDGFGTALGTTTLAADGSCDTAQNESTTSDDCDDDPLACGAGCFPGNPAADVCDGLDQDCDSLVDDDPDLTWYHDADGDGFTNGADTQQACTDPDGAGTEWVASPTTDDCNDADAGIFPGASETPDDGIDQDCSGTDTITCIVDADQDGFGTALGSTTLAADGSCDTAQGESTTSDDCDDAEPTANPSGTEVADDGVDQDCSGTDTITCIVDADQDGFGTALGTTTLAADGSCDTAQNESATSDDCDDDPLACGAGCFPGNPAADVCDGADQDCDSLVDEDPDLTWYHDADGDGFTNSADTQVTCTDPDGAGTEWVAGPTTDDCNDADAGIFPGASETPDDGIDQDCNGSDTITCIVDADQDGFGTVLGTTTPADDGSCDTAQGESTTSDDCDDAEPTANPSGTEVPDDGIDQDCSGTDTITCIVDADQDGFGTALGTTTLAADGSCDTAQNESTTSDDCDDDPLACGAGCFPGNPALDVCDGLDQDCDSLVDEDPDLTWYHDADGDGFTNGADTQQACTDPDGAGTEWVASPTTDDCNDADAAIFPGATETPDDGIDQDCSGTDTITCIVDADQDGFGTSLGTTTLAADGSCDTAQGESTTSDDCDDAEPTANPSGTEVPDDGVDQDCSGTDTITCIVDADQDGFGTALGTTTLAGDGSCDTVQGESTTSDDCDDDPLSCGAGCFPGNLAEDVCDGADQDCDSLVDEDPDLTWYHDADGDGFTNSADTQVTCTDPDGAGTEWVSSPTTDDCNDADAGIFPGATETPDDGTDQDCSGSDTITCIVDADQDGFGTALGTTTPAEDGSCDTAQGESTTSDDCDDAEPTANPSGTEVPDDGIDQDCSGTDTITCIVDADQDGFGTALGTTTLAADGSCDTAQNESTTSDDCDDDPLACGAGCFPGNPAADVCDGLDQDCDSLVDDDPDLTWYHDADGDGFTNGADTQQACTDPDGAGTEWVASPTTDDCNDADAGIFPGASETPDDGIDQDCSGTDTITCIVDADQDGFGTALGSTTLAADGSCDTAQGESTTSDDCDDAEPTANPSGTEVADDGVDQDCSGTDTITCIVDADQDGFGTALGTTTLAADGSCDTAQNESATSDDCDDDPLACGAGCFPGNPAADVCDGADQDCDSLVDEDPDLTWYHDADGDGFTNSADTQVPGQPCGGRLRRPGPDTITCIVDADQDSYGTSLGTTTLAGDGTCDTAQSESSSSDDCNDGDAAINPAGTEIADDGIDQDCNGARHYHLHRGCRPGHLRHLAWHHYTGRGRHVRYSAVRIVLLRRLQRRRCCCQPSRHRDRG